MPGIIGLQNRTEAKLRFAEVHLNQLIPINHVGSDFERAHQESFLFHLFGAKDSFLAELNIYYGCNLSSEKITLGRLRDIRKKQGKDYSEITEIFTLEQDENSWLSHAKVMRDHSTHILGVARTFYHGGPEHGKIFLRNPKTGKDIEIHYVDEFKNWLLKMRNLLLRLRESAIKNNS